MKMHPFRVPNGINLNKKEVNIINEYFSKEDRIEFTNAKTGKVFTLPVLLFGELNTYFSGRYPEEITKIIVDRLEAVEKGKKYSKRLYAIEVVGQPIECYRKLLGMIHEKGLHIQNHLS